MNAGLMDKLITIKAPTVVDNDYGANGGTTTYSTLTTAWARMVFNGGTEQVNSDQKQIKQSVTFMVHYNSSINAKCRIEYGGFVYNIKQVSGFGTRNLQYMKIESEVYEN